MRIVSLVPHATELLFALGLGDQVVGVTHECDHPAEARERRHVTRDRLPAGLDAAGIDAAVRDATLEGASIYELDAEALEELAPDLIVTQALCAVCAVSPDDVTAATRAWPSQPQVVSLDPKTFDETLADVRTIAQATDTKGPAVDLIARMSKRVDAVKLAVRAELDRAADRVPLRERFAALRAEHPLPRRTGKKADKAFFDELSGDL